MSPSDISRLVCRSGWPIRRLYLLYSSFTADYFVSSRSVILIRSQFNFLRGYLSALFAIRLPLIFRCFTRTTLSQFLGRPSINARYIVACWTKSAVDVIRRCLPLFRDNILCKRWDTLFLSLSFSLSTDVNVLSPYRVKNFLKQYENIVDILHCYVCIWREPRKILFNNDLLNK